MKIIKILLFTFLINFCFMLNVFAQGNVSISTSSLSMTKGESKTFTITANNSAGRVDISSSNNDIVSVSKLNTFLDMSSDTITVTANNSGSTTIKIYVADMTTYDDEDLSGKTYVINVNVNDVIKEETNIPKNDTSITNNKENDKQNNNSNINVTEKNTTKTVDKKNIKSNNTNLKELKIEGFELTKVDDNHYNLNVNNSIKSINILAVTEDNDTIVNGIGIHELNIGDNEINLEVVAPNGTKRNIILSINRNDKLTINDLKEILNDNSINDIEIYIDNNTIISKDDLNLIKASKKTVLFSYYNEDNKKIYSWVVDGKSIDKSLDINTSIILNKNNIKKLKKISNYADGIFINFKHNGNLPNGVSIKLYVGDKFENGDVVNLYYYNEKNNILELKKESIKVEKGYVKFSIDHCSDYFITMSNINSSNNRKSNNVLPIIIIVELVIVFGIMIVYILKLKKQKK